MNPYFTRVLVVLLTTCGAASLGLTMMRPSDGSMLRYWWGIVGAGWFSCCSLLLFADYRKRGGKVPLVAAIAYMAVALVVALVSAMMLLFGRIPL